MLRTYGMCFITAVLLPTSQSFLKNKTYICIKEHHDNDHDKTTPAKQTLQVCGIIQHSLQVTS